MSVKCKKANKVVRRGNPDDESRENWPSDISPGVSPNVPKYGAHHDGAESSAASLWTENAHQTPKTDEPL